MWKAIAVAIAILLLAAIMNLLIDQPGRAFSKALATFVLWAMVAVIIAVVFWSRKVSAEYDFRRALNGKSKPFKSARFKPDENIAAFRKVWAQDLGHLLGDREVSAVRAVAPELAVFLELQVGRTIGDALTELDAELGRARNRWWTSLEMAEQQRERFKERVTALLDGAETHGECPSCDSIIPLLAKECPKCGAQFGASSAWVIKPLV